MASKHGYISPATGAISVTPNDSTTFAETKAIYVGGLGDLRVEMSTGEDVTFAGVQAGSVLPIVVTKVFATNTSATSILRLT